ncbi:MAG: diguanylate cyclase [Xanthomonadaceae bacterium]|nr:diguanylate cyclase [Xanthomonadaceae bacterium]
MRFAIISSPITCSRVSISRCSFATSLAAWASAPLPPSCAFPPATNSSRQRYSVCSLTPERLREGIAAIDFADIDPELHITSSFGVAEAAAVDDHDRLPRRADQALYRAKANGRNRVEA